MKVVTPTQLARWSNTHQWEQNVFDEPSLTVGALGPFAQGEAKGVRMFRQDAAILVRNRIARMKTLFPHMDAVASQAALGRLSSALKAAAYAIVVWPTASPPSERLKVWYYPVSTEDLDPERMHDPCLYPPLRFALVGQHLDRELEPAEVAQLRLRVDAAMEQWWREHHQNIRPT